MSSHGTLVVKSNDPDFPPGTGFVEVVRDGGQPGGAGDGWDIFDVPAGTCAGFLAEAAAAPAILSGNISIRDLRPDDRHGRRRGTAAAPLPST